MLSRSIRDIGSLTEEEAEMFREFVKSSEIQRIRHPLYGAVLYSPLYLLSSRKLTSNAWDQDKMLKVGAILSLDISKDSALQLSKALGNNKPALLVKMETLLWECILEIATGKDVCYNALSRFFSNADWDAIAMVSEVDRAHFADGEFFSTKTNQALISARQISATVQRPAHLFRGGD